MPEATAPMRLEQKLTIRALGWTRGKIEEAVGQVPRDTGRVLLGRIAGVVVGTKNAKDMNDDIITGLKGNFRGQSALEVDGVSGALVTSGVCFLPGGIQGMIEQDLADAKQHDANATVRFAFDVYAKPATNKAGYTFDAENLLPGEQADPLTELLVAAEQAQPLALPAPDGKKGK